MNIKLSETVNNNTWLVGALGISSVIPLLFPELMIASVLLMFGLVSIRAVVAHDIYRIVVGNFDDSKITGRLLKTDITKSECIKWNRATLDEGNKTVWWCALILLSLYAGLQVTTSFAHFVMWAAILTLIFSKTLNQWTASSFNTIGWDTKE